MRTVSTVISRLNPLNDDKGILAGKNPHGQWGLKEERRFLSNFQGEAQKGGVIAVVKIQQAFESLVGRKVAKTTIYRMLDRHGWRKTLPRPRHPKSDQQAQEGFKKTRETGAKVH